MVFNILDFKDDLKEIIKELKEIKNILKKEDKNE